MNSIEQLLKMKSRSWWNKALIFVEFLHGKNSSLISQWITFQWVISKMIKSATLINDWRIYKNHNSIYFYSDHDLLVDEISTDNPHELVNITKYLDLLLHELRAGILFLKKYSEHVHLTIHIYLNLDYKKIVKVLTGVEENINQRDYHFENTALHYAANYGNFVDLVNNSMHLNWKLKFMDILGFEKIVEKLIESGADINARNYRNHTALNTAAAHGKLFLFFNSCKILKMYFYFNFRPRKSCYIFDWSWCRLHNSRYFIWQSTNSLCCSYR